MRALHFEATAYTFFASTHGPVSRINHISATKQAEKKKWLLEKVENFIPVFSVLIADFWKFCHRGTACHLWNTDLDSFVSYLCLFPINTKREKKHLCNWSKGKLKTKCQLG